MNGLTSGSSGPAARDARLLAAEPGRWAVAADTHEGMWDGERESP